MLPSYMICINFFAFKFSSTILTCYHVIKYVEPVKNIVEPWGIEPQSEANSKIPSSTCVFGTIRRPTV